MSFWSLVLEPGKKYEKEVENGIQVTRATLDTSQASGDDGIVQIILDYEGKEMTVGNLSVKHGVFQTSMDLTFSEGDKVAFTTSGAKLPVSLTGVTGVDNDEVDDEELEDLDDDYMDSTMSDSDDEVPDLVNNSKKRRLEVAEKFRRPAKSAKLANGSQKGLTLNGESFMSDDEDDSSYNPTGDLSSMGEELLGEEEEEDLDDEELDSDDDDDDLEEEEDDEDDEDEEMEEEEEEETPAQKKKSGKHNSVGESPAQKKKELSKDAQKSKKEQKTPAKDGKAAAKEIKTPAKDGKAGAKEGKTPKKSPPKAAGEAKTPSQDKAKSPKENKAVKALKAEGKDTPKSEKKKLKEANKGTPQQKQETASPKKQMRSGGVMVEDITLGTAEAAKKGSNVSVYYVGRLKSNNKVFDSQLSGPPLKFVLGRGEVIPGWDIGLVGMKVGGKRKLFIPSAMAYGKKGAPPEIPPQANLEFEVTMISCR